MTRGLRISPPDESPAEPVSPDQITREVDRCLRGNDVAGAYSVLTAGTAEKTTSARMEIMAGLLAVKLGNRDHARKHFAAALFEDAGNFDARYNLALLDMLDGHYDKAGDGLIDLLREAEHRAPLYNDLAVMAGEQQRPRSALAAFLQALRHDPNYSHARNNAMQFCLERGLATEGRRLLRYNAARSGLNARSQAEIDRWTEVLTEVVPREVAATVSVHSSRDTDAAPMTGKRLAVFANQRTFIEPLMAELGETNDVKLFDGATAAEMKNLLNWADLAWFEWCDNLMITASQLPKLCPVICRLHSYEVFTDMPGRVDWSKVDHLLFVNDSVRDLFRRQIATPVATSVIHNGVDLDRFTIPAGKQRSKKIAFVGYINYKKNPELLLYAFKKIHQHDPEYTLHIAGLHQDARIAVYFDHFLKQNPLPVQFDGWVDDMPAWYADKGYVISTSLFESFHYSIAEGMASGVLPLIHHWYGADFLYPGDLLFSDPDDCLELLRKHEQADWSAAAQANRTFIESRYDQRTRVAEIMQLLSAVDAAAGKGAR